MNLNTINQVAITSNEKNKYGCKKIEYVISTYVNPIWPLNIQILIYILKMILKILFKQKFSLGRSHCQVFNSSGLKEFRVSFGAVVIATVRGDPTSTVLAETRCFCGRFRRVQVWQWIRLVLLIAVLRVAFTWYTTVLYCFHRHCFLIKGFAGHFFLFFYLSYGRESKDILKEILKKTTFYSSFPSEYWLPAFPYKTFCLLSHFSIFFCYQ